MGVVGFAVFFSFVVVCDVWYFAYLCFVTLICIIGPSFVVYRCFLFLNIFVGMEDFFLLAVPNIESVRFFWYLKVIGLLLVFGVCLFFLLYFVVIYRREKDLSKTLRSCSQQSHILEKHMFVERVAKSAGKQKLLLYVEYLEKFVTMAPYANLSELFLAE